MLPALFHPDRSLVTCRPMRTALRLLLLTILAALVPTQAPTRAARALDLDQATIADLNQSNPARHTSRFPQERAERGRKQAP